MQETTKNIVLNNAKSQSKPVFKNTGENSPIFSAVAAAIFSVLVYLFIYGRPKKKKETQDDVSVMNSAEETDKEAEPLIESIEDDSKEIELQRLKDFYDKDLITKEVYESRQLDILKDKE